MTKITCTRRHWFGALALTTMLVAPHQVMAQQIQPAIGDGTWYYSIGGGAPISPAPNINAIAITIDGSDALTLPRACGSLDPTIAISNTLGNVADGFDQLDDLLVAAATEAIAALPAIILQRANPGLYEHFQNALLSAKATYDLLVKSCEEYVEDFAAGENPLSDWVRGSKRETWQRELANEDADSVAAETTVNQANGDLGRGWVGGEKRGGVDQPPIEINRDVATAGYNVILGRPVDATGAPPASDARLGVLFETAEAAGDFAVNVLGDHILRTCQGCTSSTTAGVGLQPIYGIEREEITEVLTEIANADDAVPLAALDEISAGSASVTPQLIDAIREVEDDQDRAILVTRLAGDIATARTVEQALSLRRILYTGRKVPEVAVEGRAVAYLDATLDELEEEIEAFLFEPRIQRELMSQTARTILVETDRLTTSAAGASNSQIKDPNVLLRGAIVE